jgi:hypothetical protein
VRRRRRGQRVGAVVGLLGATAVSVAAGLLPGRPERHAPVWLFGRPATSSGAEAVAGTMFLVGVGLLTLAWVLLVRSEPSVRRAVGTGLLWSLPLLINTPAASHDIHAYLAQGMLLREHLDPNVYGPHELAPNVIVAAVDPLWRGVPAPYGPLALGVSRLAAAVGVHSQIGGLLVLRVVACLGVAVAAWCVLRLTSERRGSTLALVAASPLTLIAIVSAAHHEGLLIGLVMLALLAHRQGWPTTAYALAAAAALVKVPGLVALGGLVVVDLWSATWPGRVLVSARAAVACAVPLALGALLVPDPLGWINALSTPGLGHTKWAPVQLAVTYLPGGKGFWRPGMQGVAVVIVLTLYATARRRPVSATVGWGLLAVALLGPVLYPWYLVPPAFVLATTSGGAGRRVARLAGGLAQGIGLPRLGNVGLLIGR